MSSQAQLPFFLCIDCGGTKTAVAIANNLGEIVIRATGGPSNFAYLGLTNFLKTIQSVVEDALKQLDPSREENWRLPPKASVFRAAWLGVSGVDSPANIALLTPPLAELLSLPPDHHLTICNDTHLLAAPLHSYPYARHAIGVIAGTGSIAALFQRGKDGRMLDDIARVGGWGWILGDEGGGFDVGRTSIRSILREYEDAILRGDDDPLESTKQSWLVREVLTLFGVKEPTELLSVIHDPDPEATEEVSAVAKELNNQESPIVHEPGNVKEFKLYPHRLIAREKRLSQLAPLVFTAAFTHNDSFALRILAATAHSLASQISSLLRRATSPLQRSHGKTVLASDSILCFGGSLVGVEAYRKMIVDALRGEGHVFHGVEFVGDAARAGVAGLVRHFEGNAK